MDDIRVYGAGVGLLPFYGFGGTRVLGSSFEGVRRHGLGSFCFVRWESLLSRVSGSEIEILIPTWPPQ